MNQHSEHSHHGDESNRHRAWPELLGEDFLFVVPAVMVLCALLVTTLHAGFVSQKMVSAVIMCSMAVGTLGFVLCLSIALNTFRERYDI